MATIELIGVGNCFGPHTKKLPGFAQCYSPRPESFASMFDVFLDSISGKTIHLGCYSKNDTAWFCGHSFDFFNYDLGLIKFHCENFNEIIYLLNELLIESPVNSVIFLSCYGNYSTFGAIKHIVSIDVFAALHLNNGLNINTLYYIGNSPPNFDLNHRFEMWAD